MNKSIFLIILITLCSFCSLSAQSYKQIKYYGDKNFSEEVSKGKAQYVETTFLNADSLYTTEIKEIKSGKLISKIYEPTGTDRIKTGRNTVSLNYNFKLNYTDTICADSIANVKINDILQDDNAIGYIAPKIATGDKTIIEYLQNHIYYPVLAVDNSMQGRVYVFLTINKSGKVEKIAIKKSAGIILDKEAARVLRELKFSNPATLNGVPQSFCMVIPVSFVLM